MHTFSQAGRNALATIGRYLFSRPRDLERELLTASRQLSALRNDYLELGLQASLLAGERDAAIAAWKDTEAYINSGYIDCTVEAECGKRVPADTCGEAFSQWVAQTVIRDGDEQSENNSPGENRVEANDKSLARWGVLDMLKEYFTPRSLLLEAEISSVYLELETLGDNFLALAERTNTIAAERDTVLIELAKVRNLAEPLMPGTDVKPQSKEQTRDVIADSSTDMLNAVRERLNKTQAEKNDVSIELAESEDQVTELRHKAARLHEEIDKLKQHLSSSEKENAETFLKLQKLTKELEKSQIYASKKERLQDDELLRVHSEYADARNNDQQYVKDLGQRYAQLESALLTANHTIEDLRQSLADASYSQKLMTQHAGAPSSELNKGARQQKNSSTTGHHKVRPEPVEPVMANRRESNTSWTSIAAGLIFTMGAVASVVKIWDMDSRMIHRTVVDKQVSADTEKLRDVDQRGTDQALPLLPEVVALASVETAGIRPAKSIKKVEKAAPLIDKVNEREHVPAFQPHDSPIKKTLSKGAKRKKVNRRLRIGSGHVRAYFMGDNSDIDISYNTCIQDGGDAKGCAFLEKNMFEEGVIRLASGVQYTVIRNGSGASPGPEDRVLVNFRSMLLDGTEFDSSRRHGGASSFRVDEAIPGLQDILQYMEEGAKWEVYIPAELAFRKPAEFGGQTVVFELELISIEDPQTLNGGAEVVRENAGSTS